MKSGQLIRQVVNKINEVDFNNLDERRHFGEFYEQLLNDLQSAGNAGEYYTPRAPDRSAPWRNAVRSRLRHRRFSNLRHTAHGEELRQDAETAREDAGRIARGGEEAASPHALRHQHPTASRRRNREYGHLVGIGVLNRYRLQDQRRRTRWPTPNPYLDIEIVHLTRRHEMSLR